MISIASAAWLGKTGELTLALFDESKSAVMLAIGLIGSMAFWLGMMKILEEAGALKMLAKVVAPVMSKLFPEIPKNHPAIGAMVLKNAIPLMQQGAPRETLMFFIHGDLVALYVVAGLLAGILLLTELIYSHIVEINNVKLLYK